MTQSQTPSEVGQSSATLVRAARYPGLRVLAWSGDVLYASRGYEVLRARIQDPVRIEWEPVARFTPGWKRSLSVRFRLTSRLLRDGFHALAVLPSGGLMGAVPGAIVTLSPGENKFWISHKIVRGTRPLHITAVPGGAIYFGEYFDNAARDEVHIYGSADGGRTWAVVYTFPKLAIRHVHNIVYDRWENCLWVLTGDYGNECRILRASCDFNRIETVLQGNQQARTVALVPMEDGLYFSSDTPLEQNYIYKLDRKGKLSRLAPIASSSIYGCRVAGHVFFSTMVEPSEVNRDVNVRIYAAQPSGKWQSILSWEKDLYPMGLFQYGNAMLPDGENATGFVALSTVAVEKDDLVTSLYKAGSPS